MRSAILVVAMVGLASADGDKSYKLTTGPKGNALVPEPTKPGDPWAGVSGDRPLAFAGANPDDPSDHTAHWKVNTLEVACTAARDHCFPALAWAAVTDATLERSIPQAVVIGFDADGPISPWNMRGGFSGNGDKYTAYRTVPATKRNFVPGALVIGLPFPAKHPGSQVAAFELGWGFGTLERVDWDLGFAWIKGQPDPYWISTMRTAVISWRPGGKVAIVGSAKRDQLAVSPSEVILPDK